MSSGLVAPVGARINSFGWTTGPFEAGAAEVVVELDDEEDFPQAAKASDMHDRAASHRAPDGMDRGRKGIAFAIPGPTIVA